MRRAGNGGCDRARAGGGGAAGAAPAAGSGVAAARGGGRRPGCAGRLALLCDRRRGRRGGCRDRRRHGLGWRGCWLGRRCDSAGRATVPDMAASIASVRALVAAPSAGAGGGVSASEQPTPSPSRRSRHVASPRVLAARSWVRRQRRAAGCGRGRRPGSPRPTADAGRGRRGGLRCLGRGGRGLGRGLRRLGRRGRGRRRLGRRSRWARGGLRRLGCRLQPRLGIGALQGADGLLEGHAERLEQAGGRALAVADDGRQHDGAVDLLAARLLGGGGGGLQHAQQLGVGPRLGARLRAHVLQQPPEIARYVGAEPGQIDVGRLQDQRRLGVLGQRQQQVLERDQPVRLLAREPMRPLQALAEIGRHRNRSELLRKGLRHQLLPDAVRTAPAAPAAPARPNAQRGMARQAHPIQVRRQSSRWPRP